MLFLASEEACFVTNQVLAVGAGFSLARRPSPRRLQDVSKMTDSAVSILNLVYRYAELIDSGDLEGAARLFVHARIHTSSGEIGAEEVLAMWRSSIILYEDGTPRTKHLITNPIVEVDEGSGKATCRTYYTVMQQVGDGPLTPIICGRYHDWFQRVDGEWRFYYRDYSLHDMVGDMSQHSRNRRQSIQKPLADGQD